MGHRPRKTPVCAPGASASSGCCSWRAVGPAAVRGAGRPLQQRWQGLRHQTRAPGTGTAQGLKAAKGAVKVAVGVPATRRRFTRQSVPVYSLHRLRVGMRAFGPWGNCGMDTAAVTHAVRCNRSDVFLGDRAAGAGRSRARACNRDQRSGMGVCRSTGTAVTLFCGDPSMSFSE